MNFERLANSEDPEVKFKEFWEKKAHDWIKEIRLVKFSEKLESQLILSIDKTFVDEYLHGEKRNLEQLQIFMGDCFKAMEKDQPGDELSKFQILIKIKEDLADLLEAERNQRNN